MKKYLIIGNGVAGTSAAEQIKKHDPDGVINMVTDEDLAFYYRIRLPEVLAGAVDEKALVAKPPEWYKNHDILLHTGLRIVEVDLQQKVAIASDRQRFSFDALLIATGSHSFMPPIKGADKKGVFTLRNISDARDITAYAGNIDSIVMIGGGLLGLEAGNALAGTGKKITVVEFMPRLLPRQLDTEGAFRLQKLFAERGFSFRLGARTKEITGANKVEGVLLEDGTKLATQMVIISAGVRPNLELAESLGASLDKGIKVDTHLRTTLTDIYAAGDVTEFEGNVYGIWPAAMEQGKIAGANMAGLNLEYNGTTMSNILKVAGIDLAAAGDIDAENRYESRVADTASTYRKIVLDQDRIIGCIMLGDLNGFHEITRAITEKTSITEIAADLLPAT